MRNIHRQIQSEMGQSPELRRSLYRRVEKLLGNRALVAFFTSFNYPVDIMDDDCDMLQSVMQSLDCENGLILMISSPGGDGLAAERIVNACRACSGTDDFWALVPGKAKSAATIITMGASKILMGPASELGPVDPQILKEEDGIRKAFSAHSLVSGYERLFREVAETNGPIEPYLQQLSRYDDREITNFRELMKLSEDIAIKLLKRGMMAGVDESEIRERIQIFLNPDAGTLSHARPIYSDEAQACGLVVDKIDIHSDQWRSIYELYARVESFVSVQACKAIESAGESFFVGR